MTKREFDVVDSKIAVEEATAEVAFAERELAIVTTQADAKVEYAIAKRDRALIGARQNVQLARWKLEREEAALRMCQFAAETTFDS